MFNMTDAELIRTGALLAVMLLAIWHSHRSGYGKGMRTGFIVGVNGTVELLHKEGGLSAQNTDDDREATLDEIKAHLMLQVRNDVIKNGADDESRL